VWCQQFDQDDNILDGSPIITDQALVGNLICDFGTSGLVEARVENRLKAREKRVAAAAGHLRLRLRVELRRALFQTSMA
jgi:hypothetical protein